MKRRSLLFVGFVMLAVGCSSTAPHPVKSAPYTNNATWLGYGYLHSQAGVDLVPQTAFEMKNNYRVPYWFVNVGLLNSSGQMSNPPVRMVAFLDALKTWEVQNGYQFKVLAWINGDTGRVDVNDAAVRTQIVEETKKFVSTTAPGSFVMGATRAFDGVQLDLEPAGPDGSDMRFDNLNRLMAAIKNSFHAMGLGSKLTSFTAAKYGMSNRWSWPAAYFYSMGTNIDLLAAMTYDTGITNGLAYQDWMRSQTTNILKAVSGAYWNNNAGHPVPANGVKVLIGFPAYPNSRWHTNTAENISYAAPGVKAALADLASRGDHSTNLFLGAGTYLHAGGTGTDGYAEYSKDWRWFREYWLDSW